MSVHCFGCHGHVYDEWRECAECGSDFLEESDKDKCPGFPDGWNFALEKAGELIVGLATKETPMGTLCTSHYDFAKEAQKALQELKK